MEQGRIGIIVISLLFSITAAVHSQSYKIKAIIQDKQTGKGMEGVDVIVKNKLDNKGSGQAISGIEGQVEIENLNAGTYIVQSSHVGYITDLTQVKIENRDVEVQIVLEANILSIGEVEISSLRYPKKMKEAAIPIGIIDGYTLDRIPAVTPSDLMQNIPGVSLARDGIWATSINIRGLSEQRVILLVDGYRVETATDIAAAMALIDNNDIEQIEVIKGSASSIYGTGALGGVVNIITKNPGFSDGFKFGGTISSGYGSVNNMYTEHIALNNSDSKWFMKIGGTYRDADNTETPEGTLQNSQFTDYNIATTIGFKINDRQIIKVNYQRFTGEDIGIPGGVAFSKPAIATYPTELRELIDVEYTLTDLSPSLKRISARAFSQFILRDVQLYPNIPSDTNYALRRVTTPVVFTPTADHSTLGGNVQTDWQFGNKHTIIAGIDIWQRTFKGSREKLIHQSVLDSMLNQIALIEIIRGEKPLPNSLFRSAGIFIQDDVSLVDNKLTATIGARYEYIYVDNDEVHDPDYMIINGTRNDNPPTQRITFTENNEVNHSWAANIGLLYNFAKDIQATLSLGNSFRSPVLEERFKYIDLGSSVRLGNPALLPEHGYSADLGFKVFKPRFNLMVNGFINKLTDLIVEEPGKFIYSLTSDENLIDTLPALINTNVEKALLYGFDLDVQYNVYQYLVLYNSSSYVRGENRTEKTNLPLIPPLSTRTGLRYGFAQIINLDFSAVIVARQDKVTEGETETDGYIKFDLMLSSTQMSINPLKLQLFAGIQNLTDVAYTNHLATNRGSINYEPGRNIYGKLIVHW
ncbi:MAG: TonB-dependent receptor [Bacteroidales bacterium]|nr:TonB-dependent receptor [Bacteroidales bacterium]